MKKMFCILLVLSFILTTLCTAFAAEPSDVKITVNGIPLIMLENDQVIKPIEEDGVLYVPLTSFLTALDIHYDKSENLVAIKLSESNNVEKTTPIPTEAPTPSPTPQTPYDTLSPNDKVIVNKLLANIDGFNDPSSVRVLDVRTGKDSWSGGYFLKISAANMFGGKVDNWYYFSHGVISFDGMVGAYSDPGEFDIAAINRALKYKLQERGY